MSDILNFAGEHYIVFLFVLWCLASLIRSLWRRLFSTVKVAIRGWPPAHLDADGDWKPEPEPEEDVKK